jgi:large subunit ribosomal protein L22
LTVADTDTRQTVARLRHLRTSPTKVRPVLQLISGKDVVTARDTLRLSDRAVSHDVGKLLDSAVANAEHNDNIPEDELFVAKAFADEGPTLKRWRPRARGRGTRIRKRTTHITIVVARFGGEQLQARQRAEAATTRGPRRPTRRRVSRAAEVEHDHEHDHEHGEETELVEGEPAPAKKATKAAKGTSAKKVAKKSTKKAGTTAEKATTAKKSTAKKSAAKKSAAKKSTAEKSTKTTTAKKTPRKKPSESDEDT